MTCFQAAQYFVPMALIAECYEVRRMMKMCHDCWMECEIPEEDAAGKKLKTASSGKLGRDSRKLETPIVYRYGQSAFQVLA